MNLIEAIRSGKQYRRIGDTEWRTAAHLHDKTGAYYQYVDILADDWEIEEKRVSISEAMLLEAWQKALALHEYSRNYDVFEILKKDLGL